MHSSAALTLYRVNNLRHPTYEPWGNSEIISFTADRLAFVIEDTGLGEMFDLLMLQTLLRVREYDGKPLGKIVARITRIEVADARESERERSKLRLVKE